MMSGSLFYKRPPNALETGSLAEPEARLAARKAQKFLSQPANRVSATGVYVAMPSLLYGC